MLGGAFVAVAATTYLSYWLVFVAPDLPAQLAQLAPAAAPADAPLAPPPPGVDWFKALSGVLQPSIFR